MAEISIDTSAGQSGVLLPNRDEADFVVPSAEGIRIPVDPATVEGRLGGLLELVNNRITIKP